MGELGPNVLLFFFVRGYLPRSKNGPIMYTTVRDSYNSQHIPSRRQHLPPHAVAEMMDTTMTDNRGRGINEASMVAAGFCVIIYI